MDIIIVTIILHIIWYAPCFLPREQEEVSSDTVSSVNKGAPYYHMGKFVGYIEV